MEETKFCSHCGEKIAKEAVICPKCGCQVAATQAAPNIIINNSNQNQVNAAVPAGKMKNKWVALLLWWFLGFLGAHKFYEDKMFMGVLYIFTGAFLGLGWCIDFWVLLFKPTHYYV